MGLRATVMNRLDKLIEASAIMLKELDSLRRQKREWELERANLLAELEYLQVKLALTPAQRIVADTKEAIDKILKNE
jgi:hypothetical protein